jgi:hypothetical protein
LDFQDFHKTLKLHLHSDLLEQQFIFKEGERCAFLKEKANVYTLVGQEVL